MKLFRITETTIYILNEKWMARILFNNKISMNYRIDNNTQEEQAETQYKSISGQVE